MKVVTTDTTPSETSQSETEMSGERGLEPPTSWSRTRAKFIDSVSLSGKSPQKASSWTQFLDPTVPYLNFASIAHADD